MTKWGDRPHWVFDAIYLGADEHGDWIGIRAGTEMARPGMAFAAEVDQVGLAPRDAGWMATFHQPGAWVATYVDMTSVPWWDGRILRAVDLDLDVIRTAEGDVFVDDEDEFAEHQVTFGYPPEVIALAQEACAWTHHAVLQGRPPFDDASSDRWFEVFARLSG